MNKKGIGSKFARCLVRINKNIISKTAIEILSPDVFNLESTLINSIKQSLREDTIKDYCETTDGKLFTDLMNILGSNCV